MPNNDIFELSPVYHDQENQDKIKAMIERVDDEDDPIILDSANMVGGPETGDPVIADVNPSNMMQENKLPLDASQLEHQPQNAGVNLDFIQQNRTSDNIRRGFLSKLTYDKIWLTPQDKPKLYETAIIFDWDDTIMCTSFINPTGYFNPNQKIDPKILK